VNSCQELSNHCCFLVILLHTEHQIVVAIKNKIKGKQEHRIDKGNGCEGDGLQHFAKSVLCETKRNEIFIPQSADNQKSALCEMCTLWIETSPLDSYNIKQRISTYLPGICSVLFPCEMKLLFRKVLISQNAVSRKRLIFLHSLLDRTHTSFNSYVSLFRHASIRWVLIRCSSHRQNTFLLIPTSAHSHFVQTNRSLLVAIGTNIIDTGRPYLHLLKKTTLTFDNYFMGPVKPRLLTADWNQATNQ